MMLVKMSVNYWMKHKKRLASLAIITVLGAAALCIMSLFMCSKKQQELNRIMDLHGNYDVIFYGIHEEDVGLIAEHEKVLETGYYRELGYAGVVDNAGFKIASFPDEKSELLYHMTCVKGRYPEKEEEVAIDMNAAKELGVAPVPGQKIELAVYDLEKKFIEMHEFVISGVFHASDTTVYGGYYRYPGYMDAYDVPAVFLYDSNTLQLDKTCVTAYMQTDEKSGIVGDDIAQEDFRQIQGWECTDARTFAYSYIMGVEDYFMMQSLEVTIQNLLQAIQDGNVWKDFYSAVFMPLFAILLFVMIVVSMYSLIRSLLLERADEIAVLRSLGMEKNKVFSYLFLELFALVTGFVVMGMLVGAAVHALMINGINSIYGIHMPYGFQVSRYVSVVTASPWAYTIVVMECSSIAAFIVPLYRMTRATPVAIAEKRFVKERKRKQKHFERFETCSWKKLLGEHLRFHDVTVLVLVCIVMGTIFLGYNYFRALADKNNVTFLANLQEAGLEQWDYHAERASIAGRYTFMVENHHDYGVCMEEFSEMAACPEITSAFGRIVNRSTRLAYRKTEDVLLPDCLRLRRYESSEDAFAQALYEAEDAMISDVGYASDEEIYGLPSIGVLREEVEALTPYIKEGTINLVAMEAGEEAVLVIPDKFSEVLSQFHAGDALPFSDVALTAVEEQYNLTMLNPSDAGLVPSYTKDVIEPESGNQVPLTSYALGKRKDISVKIGAVVVLEDVSLLKKYTVPASQIWDEEFPSSYAYWEDEDAELMEAYSPSLVCLPETFAQWGLPDQLFTEVNFALGEHADAESANTKWYQVLAESEGVSFQSSYEIREQMKQEAGNIMAICYLMMGVLIFTGMITIMLKLYHKIQLQSQTIAKLRAIGMPVLWLEKMLLRQNVIYPVVGAIAAVIPVSLCQLLFLYIRQQVDAGAWVSMSDTGELAWWFYVPYRYSLFAYHPIWTLLVVTFGMLVLMLVATLPQLMYIKRQSIAETISRNVY